ncbi:MAG: DinB family protein [Vicinamibacterales bacterium]
MTRMLTTAALAAALILPTAVLAQDNPATAAAKKQYDMIKGNLAKSAEMVPENLYSFKPTPEVRSFADLFGHLADAQFSMCGAASGMKPPMSGIEKGMKSKAELVKAMNAAIKFCDEAFASMTDAKGMENAQFFLGPTPRLWILAFNTSHANEHYGNLVTYLRLNKMVPPSSAGGM